MGCGMMARAMAHTASELQHARAVEGPFNQDQEQAALGAGHHSDPELRRFVRGRAGHLLTYGVTAHSAN